MKAYVSMKMIAARLGVSKATVSLALRNSAEVSESMKARVRTVAEEMGYKANPALGQLLSQVRSRDSYRATLGLINANTDARAFTRHPTIPDYLRGIRARAELHGYRLDDFWLHEPEMKADRLKAILEARGIKGALVVGLMEDATFPEKLLPVAESLPTVVTGVRTHEPTLPYVCSDHHGLVLLALENALRLGYRRPGLVIDGEIDRLVEGRFTAAYLYGQLQLPARDRLPPFYQGKDEEADRKAFAQWLEARKPDVLFTLYNDVEKWLTDLGLKVPAEMGLIQLEWRRSNSRWAGLHQHNDRTGEAAVDTLVAMLHSGESGLQAEPRAVLIAPSWVDGETVRSHGPEK